jgi:lipopolysaccharide/colanic/teichoic acid biosynthesis glycosyltransferase
MTDRPTEKVRRIAITGASGYIGKQLVPLLLEQGVELLLIGRNPIMLSTAFPGIRCCHYGSLPQEAREYDLLLHLAVMNNNAHVDIAEFEAVNVNFLLETVELARNASIGNFVNVSSVHALDKTNLSAYARSKRSAAKRLRDVTGIPVMTVYLPLVYGTPWPSSLAALNKLPSRLARAVFAVLASVKPTLDVARLAEFATSDHPSHQTSVILSDGQRRNLIFHFSKRAVDILSSLFILLLFWWAMILIWIAVKLSSSGPGIFAQERIGRNGRSFTCYKFRTMVVGAPNVATHDASTTLITPIGKFLRKTKFDELPQIFNVLLNDMSFVGPRPCLPSQTALIEARRARMVLHLKPGISGLAQINNIDMSNASRLAYWDAKYRDLQCLATDLKIMIATVLGNGRGDPIGNGFVDQPRDPYESDRKYRESR